MSARDIPESLIQRAWEAIEPDLADISGCGCCSYYEGDWEEAGKNIIRRALDEVLERP